MKMDMLSASGVWPRHAVTAPPSFEWSGSSLSPIAVSGVSVDTARIMKGYEEVLLSC